MKDRELDVRNELALFRYTMIAQVMRAEIGQRQALARELANRHWDIPGTRRTRVGEGTIRHWISLYNKRGFDGLLPKVRHDRARPRRLPPAVAELLVAIKRETPELSVRNVILKARREGGIGDDVRIPPSTVHRLLTREGLMTRKPTGPQRDMRRFSHTHAGALWQADAMHGPKIPDRRGRKRKAYLIVIIDDASRVVPYAAFTFSENTSAFLGVLREAIIRRGIPRRLYTDQGSAFRSKHLSLVCARLDIALIHATAYHAAGRGKIERMIGTVRRGFMPLLGPADMVDIEALNRRFRAWVEGEYHMSPHRGIGEMTPLDKWASCAERVRFADPDTDVDDLFLMEEARKVSKARTISFGGRLHEVRAELSGETVTLRHDPSDPGRPIQVWHDGKPAGHARPLDEAANARARREAPVRGVQLRKIDKRSGRE